MYFRLCEHRFLTINGCLFIFCRATKNEPKKTFVRALPLRIPMVVACYTQKTLAHFLLNTRGLSRVQTLLSPPQKGRRKLRGFLREEKMNSARRRKRRDFYGKKCCRDVLRSSPCVILSGARRSARSRTDLATIFL